MFPPIKEENEYLKDLSVIIRSCGERTEGLCKFSIEQNGILDEQIRIIKNVSPFSKALKKGYELGIEMDKKYTLFVDADYILLENVIPSMIMIAENLPDKTFFISPLWYDYITHTISSGGPHLYRTELLPAAIKYIPDEDESLRPETFTTKEMHKNGFGSAYLDIPIALHGFEQYYKDIFRNIINKYLKFGRRIEANVQKSSYQDNDLAAMLNAIKYAKENKIKLKLDYKQFEGEFEKTKMAEKDKILPEDIPKKYHSLMENTGYLRNNYPLRGHTYELLKDKKLLPICVSRLVNFVKKLNK